MLNFEEIKQDPANYFHDPHEVTVHKSLTKQQKFEILMQWKDDAMHERESISEGMPGQDNSELLECIGRELLELQES